ncbi:MAG: M28 family peptidase [Planctomycetes bacterium]|nr:M28 family peptidase [Planctomycetota bacterium]
MRTPCSGTPARFSDRVAHLATVAGVLLLSSALGAQAATSAAAVPAERARASITVADLREHIEYLASDELEGRAAGTRGNDRAAQYIAKLFGKLRLAKVADHGRSWFQDFEAESDHYKTVPTRNVAALLEGTDDALRDEVIVIGAHFDHVGVGRFGSREGGRGSLDDEIHNGADDNASGTAGMLELAEALAMDPPRRSVLFLAFSAEELGLLGSAHYCRDPLVPLDRTVAMFNFDMIGRSEDDYLFVGGTGTSPAFDPLIAEHLDAAGLRVERNPGGRAPSDNTPFYERDVPVLFFFTNVHVDYHRVSDEAQFINYGTEERILRAAYGLVRAVADADDRPRFARADGTALPRTMDELMRLPSRAQDLAGMARARARAQIDKKGCGRLGFAPATAARGELMIGELLSGGPAAAAGLDCGDVIVAVGDVEVGNAADVAEAMKGVKAGDRVAVRVRRGGAIETVEVIAGR